MGRFFAILAIVAGLAGGAWWGYRHYFRATGETSTAEQSGRPSGTGRRGAGDRPIPVVAGRVEQRDVAVWLDGIGTVQAFNTVTVRARVDGELQTVGFTEGQDVKAGEVLVRIDPRPLQAALAQVEAKKAQDQAMLANAQRDLARYQSLRREGNYATQQQLDTQQAQVAQLEATIRADEANIEAARVQLGYTTITSPIDGRVGMRLVDPGNMVRAGDATGLVMITQLQPISVMFTVPEQNLPAINREAAERKLEVVALDRDNTQELAQGTLTVVDNLIDQTTGTIKLKATFANEQRRLWPGQFVNVRLRLTTRKDAIVVPAQVVQRGPRGVFAFVIKEDRTVDIRPIKVGQIDQGVALVEEGLARGERVVVDGQSRLQAGTRVQPRDEAGPQSPPGNAPREPGAPPADEGRRRGRDVSQAAPTQ